MKQRPFKRRLRLPTRPGKSYSDIGLSDDPLERQLGYVNEASKQVRNLYITFLAFSLYIALVVGTVSHVDLLKGSNVQLPILGIGLPLLGFFKFTPWVYLIFYFNLLVQTYLLARKIRRLLEQNRPNRNQTDLTWLHNAPILYLIAGAHENQAERWMFRLIVWVTLLIIPLTVLLMTQISFLPYHSESITWSHRVAVLIMVGMIGVMWPLILSKAKWLYGLLGLPVVLSLIATVPDGWLDRAYVKLPDDVLSKDCSGHQHKRQVFKPTAWLFGSDHHWYIWKGNCEPDRYTGLFSRNIDVSGQVLVRRIDEPRSFNLNQLKSGDAKASAQVHGRVEGLDLRGRNLRYARLSGAWLTRVDLRNADLAYVSGERTQLQHARLREANLQGAYLGWSQLQNANLYAAKLQDANIFHAQLQNTYLRLAELQGTDLGSTKLWGIDISSTDLRGANFSNAKLQGAILSGANLKGAHFLGAEMQGVDFSMANLQGANLQESNLQGANFHSAKLQGAILFEANIWGANFRDASLELAVLREIRFEPLYAEATWDDVEWADLPPDVKIRLENAFIWAVDGYPDYVPPQKTQAEVAVFESTGYFCASNWGQPPTAEVFLTPWTAYIAELACTDSTIAERFARRSPFNQLPQLARALLTRAKNPECQLLAEGIESRRDELEARAKLDAQDQ